MLVNGLVFGELRFHVTTLLCKRPFLLGSIGFAFSIAFRIVGTCLKSKEMHLLLGFCLPAGLNNYNVCLFLMCQQSFSFSIVVVI